MKGGIMEYIPSFVDQLQNGSNPSWRDDLDTGLYHHGIKGMKWGVRRPRNEDGIIQGAGKGLFKKMKARHQRNKEAKENYKAAKAKAKKDLRDWSDKANARHATDKNYRKSGQLGADAEKAIDRYNASMKSAKAAYKQTVNANKIDRLKKRAKRYGTMAGANRMMGKALTTKKYGTMARVIAAPAAGAAKVNEAYYTGRQNSTKRKINRLSN
jgi:hypothetical protein